MRGYDRWKTTDPAQERGFPPGVEDLLGEVVEYDGRPAVIESYEEWVDADEDGQHGGSDVILRFQDGEEPREDYLRLDVAQELVA